MGAIGGPQLLAGRGACGQIALAFGAPLQESYGRGCGVAALRGGQLGRAEGRAAGLKVGQDKQTPQTGAPAGLALLGLAAAAPKGQPHGGDQHKLTFHQWAARRAWQTRVSSPETVCGLTCGQLAGQLASRRSGGLCLESRPNRETD